MTQSKRLVAASANRMISFYDLNQTNYHTPVSRIENLVGVPLCIEYYAWPKNKDARLETILVGDDLGICHMYNITTPDWHFCEFKLGSKQCNECHKTDIKGNFYQKIQLMWELEHSKQEKEKERLLKADREAKAAEALKGGPNGGASGTSGKLASTMGASYKSGQAKKPNEEILEYFKAQSQPGKNMSLQQRAEQVLGIPSSKETLKPDQILSLLKKKPTAFEKKQNGIQIIEKQIHNGWITKIKFFPDLNYIVSSSLDGFIHIHDIEDLVYKENKSFNLHQKGVNSFVYSSKHRFIASCGEERHIIMWDPFTLGALSYLYGHNTSV